MFKLSAFKQEAGETFIVNERVVVTCFLHFYGPQFHNTIPPTLWLVVAVWG